MYSKKHVKGTVPLLMFVPGLGCTQPPIAADEHSLPPVFVSCPELRTNTVH